MEKYFKLMRVHHYLKNGLIFAPLLFSGTFLDIEPLYKSIIGFIAYSLLASAIYILNDIQDIESDRLHPTKCKRPLAAGVITVHKARLLIVVLLVLSFTLNSLFNFDNISSWLCLFGYLVLNLGYSYGLKNYPIIDIAILASGFVIRVLYGAIVTDIEISSWLYLTVTAMSFYLGLGKRRNELAQQKAVSRKVLKFYTHNFLDKNMYMSLALTITFYSLWTVDPVTIARLTNPYLIWTVPLVILICMKYSLNIEKESDGDPVEVVIRDKALLAMVFIFVFVTVSIIYI